MTSQELEQVKKVSVDMLIDFDSFCKNYNLQYAISFGTALGAKRHGGFIPWDEDVDVDMPLRDYEKFVQLWFKCGDKEKYFLQTKKTDPYISLPFYRLRKNNTTSLMPGVEKVPIHWGLPIDIFPLYNVPSNKLFRKIQKKLLKKSRVWCKYAWEHLNSSSIKKWFYKEGTLIALWGARVLSDFSEKSAYVIYSWGGMDNKPIDKTVMFPYKPILFEGVELSGPAKIEEYLSLCYGDYMTPPPEEERIGHPISILDFEKDSSEYTGYFVRNK